LLRHRQDVLPGSFHDLRVNATAGVLPVEGSQQVNYKRAFVFAVTAYTLVSMARIHEILPALNPLRLGMVTGLVAIAAAVGAIRRDTLRLILASPVARGLLVVMFFAVFTIPTAVWPKASLMYVSKVYYNALALLLLAAALFVDRKASRFLIIGFVGSVALGGANAILRGGRGRFEIGMTYDANETAALFLMTVPWALYLLMTEKGWPRLLGLLAMPICVMGMLKTGSRGALLSTGALVPFLLFLAPPKKRAPFLLLIVGGAIVTGLTMGQQTIYRLRKAFDTTEYNYTTRDGRVEIWKRGLGYIKGSPVLGVGIDGFQYKELESKQNEGYGVRQAAAHNMYLQVASELGLIGFGGFMTMLIGGQLMCIRARHRAKQALARGGGLDAERDLVRANMAQASLFSLMCTGFFLSMGYSSMVYFAAGVPIGVYLSSLAGSASGGPPMAVQPRQRVRGMRGWRSARTIPAGLHGMSSSQQ
jgi:O-antigen ligase